MNLPNGATNASHPTFIEILLDETGSMGPCKDATVKGFNDFIADQRLVEGDCYITLSKFDSSEIKTPYVDLSLDMIPPLSFFPRGGTNLYDVIGKRVTDLLEARKGRTLVLVITDGDDTCSRSFTADTVKTVVASALQSGISFRYFGAGHNAAHVAKRMGFPEEVVTVFNTAQIAQAMTTMSAGTRAFRAGA